MTPEAGVWGDIDTAKETLAALQSRRLEAQTWRAAADDLKKELGTSREAFLKQLGELETQINQERRAWSAELKKQRQQNILILLLVGGLGYAAGR